ncbi:hypothetical protein K470DRAFT_219804 [Piedraia hortae CBS 480.64]|uniref:L-tryptophan decarboxylase PsiD-like domain-containing protein n=1 Tax=Piedraia hortae CBS 480.64 TaxID=1314780 RepID=A0A6A7BVL8_9PEZI|nr:hypothetical protein K470DRAFT_219804 [Piedraia hortae CBS 480.64]
MVQQHGDEHEIPDEHRVHRHSDWLPPDHRITHAWVKKQVEDTHAAGKQQLSPTLQEFKDFIENNPRIYMYFTDMFEQVPRKAPYNKDPTGTKQIHDYHQLLQVLNHTFSRAPHWTDRAANAGMVGVPMAGLLDYVMGTTAGYAAFLDPEVNKHLKKILNAWGEFLKSPKSAEVLGDHTQGWFGPVGKKDLIQVANAASNTSLAFEEIFQCDPKAKHYGFKSWDDFFTRRVHDQARPVASPKDDNVIVNACESKPFTVARNVKLRDRFWIKGQPYSVRDMLAQDPLAEEFAGGTVYQAFLSALSYHRWHSPVAGTIKRAFVQDGTYFAEPPFEGFADPNTSSIDREGITGGLGYLTALATRAIIFIEADNPAIGLMAFIGVGMDEVSTCEITVKEGQHVEKGEQTGMFHFGGSTHCLLFRKHVKVDGFPSKDRKENVPVRSELARVSA